MKIPKDAPEATAMPTVCYGAPNMYFIFASMSLFNLKEDGEMIYIIPRSWTSGAYFKRFREYFLTEGKIEHIHLFVSRNKVFDKEDVLQETIIVKVKKTCVIPKEVTVTSSKSNCDFAYLTSLTVPYNLVVSGTDYYSDARTDVLAKCLEYSGKEMDAEYLSAIYKYGVLAKSKSMWKAQDEWRLVSCDNMLADDYNCAFYPITKVYLGVNMRNDQRREVIEICKRKEIPYVGVIRSNEKYQMMECGKACEECIK